MNYGIILAGGMGTRFGASPMPKQFLQLGTKPTIIHTIEQFLMCPDFEAVVVCCPKVWVSHTKDIISQHIKKCEKVYVTEGGVTRQDTVIAGCKFIEAKFTTSSEDVVVTHDAVRPFVNQRILKENIEQAKKYGAVDTVIPATDTIVESANHQVVSNIPFRGNFYQGQTPQSFNMYKLVELFGSLSEKEKATLTDACKIFVLKGEDVKIVMGEVYNIKITTPHDLKMANALLTVGVDD